MSKVIVLVSESETSYRVIHTYSLRKREEAESILESSKSLFPYLSHRLIEVDFTP